MGRAVRQLAALIGACVLLAPACSNRDGTSASSGAATSTSTTSSVPDSSTSTTTTTATAQAATSSTTGPGSPVTVPSTTAASGANTTASPGPAVASAEGWRLAVSRPTARATVGPTVTVCYEITGTSREPDLALEVTVLRPVGAPVRVDVPVGRGSVAVALPGVAPGVYDLRIELIPNGVRVSGLAVTIPSVAFTAGGPAGSCP
jgi:hypothetical protein